MHQTNKYFSLTSTLDAAATINPQEAAKAAAKSSRNKKKSEIENLDENAVDKKQQKTSVVGGKRKTFGINKER